MSSNIRVTRICQECGNDFIAKTTVTKYCGDRCAKRAYKARKRAEKIAASDQATVEEIERPLVELQAKEFLSIKEACRLLGVSRTTMWRLTKTGRIKTAKMGRRIIIKKDDLKELFK